MDTYRLFSKFTDDGSKRRPLFSPEPPTGLTFSTISLALIWFFSFSGALICFVLAELYQSFVPEFPLVFVVVLGSQLQVLSPVTTFFMGKQLFGSVYKAYQPFRGGAKFIFLQFIGILNVSLSVLGSLVYLLMFDTQHQERGVFAVLAVAASVGNALVLLSLRFYVIPQEYIEEIGNNSGIGRAMLTQLQKHPNSHTALVAVLMVSQCVLTELARHAEALQFYCAVVSLVVHFFNGAVIHFLIGCRYTEGYSAAMVKLCYPADTVLYWLEWSFYWISMVFSFCIVLSSIRSENSSLLYVPTMLSVITTSMVLLFVRTVSFKKRRRFPPLSLLVSLSSLLVVLITLLIGVFTTYTACYEDRRQYSVVPEKPDSSRPMSYAWFLGKETDDIAFHSTLRILQGMGHGLTLLASPMSLMIGRMVYGKDFNCFRQTKFSFVFLHGLSGVLYSISVLTFLYFLFTRHLQLSLLTATTSVLSPLCLVSSFRVFEPVSDESITPYQSHSPSPSASFYERVGGPSPQNTFSYLLNGELAVGYVCALASFMIRLIVNISGAHIWGSVQIPVLPLLFVANCLFILSVPLVHISARDHGIKIFQPFSGSGVFVALQVIGWMVYGSLALFSAISFFLTFLSSSTTNRRATPLGSVVGVNAGSVTTLIDPQQLMWFTTWSSTVVGFLEFVPVFLITVSITIESRLRLSRSQRCLLARDGLERLIQLTKTAMISEEHVTQEMEETQYLLHTLLQPSLEYYGLEEDAREAFGLPSSGDANEQGPRESPTSVPLTPSSCNDGSPISPSALARSAFAEEGHQGAVAIVILLSVASVVFFVLASFFSLYPTLASALALCGFLLATVSCAGVHAGYGTLLHGGTGEFAVFIPFKGGKEFVYWQVGGWTCYACLFVISLVVTVTPSQISTTLMSIAAMFSVAGQGLILRSIPLFKRQQQGGEAFAFLEENGEGVVALLAFAAAYGSRCCTDSLLSFFGAPQSTAVDKGNVGFVLTVVSMSIALPCIFMAIGRTSSSWKRARHHHQSSGNTSEASLAEAVVNALQLTALPLGALVPLSVAYVAYALSQSYSPGIFWLMEWAVYLTFGMIISVIALSVLHVFLNVGIPSFVVDIKVCVVTCAVYGLAAIETLTMIMLVVCFPRVSTIMLDSYIAFMTVFAGYGWARIAARIACYLAMGHIVISYLYELTNLYGGSAAMNWNSLFSKSNVGSLISITFLLIIDIAIVYGCIAYLSRYKKSPTTSGCLRSEGFIRFATKYLFSNCAQYYNFRIIVDDTCVHFRDPKKKFLFSFHPHGVFPGTALFAPFTDQWQEKLGSNPTTHVSTHVASVVLNVPLVRDFNMCLGALSVSRRGIEASFGRGNSVIIVTGGQAEMLHSRISHKEMTLVAHHKGFLRVAIANRVPLVPMLCFGEQNILGLLHFPRIQRATLPLLGFPFPMVPHGRFGLPIPLPTDLVLVIGPCIDVPEDGDQNDEELVERLRVRYFDVIRELFYRHRKEAGFPDMELNLIHSPPGRKKRERPTKPLEAPINNKEKENTKESTANNESAIDAGCSDFKGTRPSQDKDKQD